MNQADLDKIKKLLDSDITDYAISKATGVSATMIGRYKNNEANIENISLKNAIALTNYYNKRKEEIKMDKIIELKKDLEKGMNGSGITIWKNKEEIFETLRTNNDPGVDWADVLKDNLAQFNDTEKIIECNNGNGEPSYFSTNDFTDIYDYFK